MENFKELWLKKIVDIYPGDTHGKRGKIVDINEAGVTFLIIECSEHCNYEVGETVFIAFSANLSFKK